MAKDLTKIHVILLMNTVDNLEERNGETTETIIALTIWGKRIVTLSGNNGFQGHVTPEVAKQTTEPVDTTHSTCATQAHQGILHTYSFLTGFTGHHQQQQHHSMWLGITGK